MTTAASRVLPLVFGVLMVGAAAYRTDGSAVFVAAAAVVAVAWSAWWRPASSVAVLLTVLTIALDGPAEMFTALAGLSAAAYLVLRHTNPTAPTMASAVGFTAAGTVAVAVPATLPWLPMAAPLAVLVGYLVAVRPYLAARH